MSDLVKYKIFMDWVVPIGGTILVCVCIWLRLVWVDWKEIRKEKKKNKEK